MEPWRSVYRRIARRFGQFLFLLWLAIVATFGLFVVNWSQPISLIQYGLIAFFSFTFAFAMAKRIFSIVLRPAIPPRLERLSRQPTVAVLYTTMNDVVETCLRSLHQTYPCDVYILDDSSDPEKAARVRQLAAAQGFTVVQRGHRRGFKAGALNHWLSSYGARYDYFALLDADSYLPPDWVAEALLFAEHADNLDVAIFQGLIDIWNLDTRFTRALAPMHRLSQDEWEKKLANYLDAITCYGHNALFRIRPLLELGGFDERYVSEDFATAVRLADRGHRTVFVPLRTYEALPENVRGFVKRQNKWTRGAMEFLHFVPPARIGLLRKLLLLMIPLGHLAYIAVMAAMVLAIFGRVSSPNAFAAFGENLLADPILYLWSIPLFRFLIVLSACSFVVTAIKLIQVRLSYAKFWVGNLLSKAVGSIMLPHEVRSILTYLVDKTRRFSVTPKDEPPLALSEILRLSAGSIAITLVLLGGIVFVNPVGAYYNILWFGSFALSPLIMYHFSGPGSRLLSWGPESALGTFHRHQFRTSREPHLNRFY